VLPEGAKYLAGVLAILVIAGESSFASVEITKHLIASDKHALEAQLTAARERATAESAEVNAARAQLTAARAQVTAARAQVAAEAARAQAAAASAQTVALRAHTPFAVAKDALARLAKTQRQVAQAASKAHARRCLVHILNHSMRQRHRPDALYRRHEYKAAASGYNAVTAKLARKAARCAPAIR
jgi:hypothetical protein